MYYDIDAVLRDDERVPVIFNSDAPGLGYLDSVSESDDLKQGAKLELPLWAVSELAAKLFVTVETPKMYSQNFRASLLAGPQNICLRERSPFYYENGIHIARFLPESKAIVNTLIKTLSVRYPAILDTSQNSMSEDVSQFTYSLTTMERDIFQIGYTAMADYLRWKSRDFELLEGYDVNKKRKLIY